MTVKELIEFLKTQPQELQVCYRIYSEQAILEKEEIIIATFCAPREDGWVQDARPDMPQQDYLMFPGN
jgi:hypothetical protein